MLPYTRLDTQRSRRRSLSSTGTLMKTVQHATSSRVSRPLPPARATHPRQLPGAAHRRRPLWPRAECGSPRRQLRGEYVPLTPTNRSAATRQNSNILARLSAHLLSRVPRSTMISLVAAASASSNRRLCGVKPSPAIRKQTSVAFDAAHRIHVERIASRRARLFTPLWTPITKRTCARTCAPASAHAAPLRKGLGAAIGGVGKLQLSSCSS
eukprot:2620038-Prymnesium_polylepis.1